MYRNLHITVWLLPSSQRLQLPSVSKQPRPYCALEIAGFSPKQHSTLTDGRPRLPLAVESRKAGQSLDTYSETVLLLNELLALLLTAAKAVPVSQEYMRAHEIRHVPTARPATLIAMMRKRFIHGYADKP
jgi:hypothetical protein